MKRSFLIAAGAALAVAACGNNSTTSTDTPSSTPAAEQAPSLPAGMYSFEPTAFSEEWSRGTTVTADGEGVRVQGDFAEAPSGAAVAGAVYVLDETQETELSGKRVRISALVRGGAGRSSYSTRDAGNSGWNEFPASQEWQLFSYEYNVANMINGGKDYIGFVPMTTEEPIEVGGLTIELVSE